MKQWFRASSLLALCLLAACATTSPEKKDAPASQWQLFPAASLYSFQVISGPSGTVEGPSEVVLTTTPDADLMARMSDAATDKSVSGSVDMRQNGATWSVFFAPPRDGSYWLFLLAKPHSRAGDERDVVARLAFNAALRAPPNWTLAAGFARLGLSIVSAGQSTVEDVAEVAISARQDVAIACSLTHVATGDTSAGGVEIERRGDQYVIGAAFSHEGEYLLTLFGKPSAEEGDDWPEMARVRFTATVSAAMKVPPHWVPSPAFKKYGVVITALPDARVGEWAEVSLTADEDVSVSTSLFDALTHENADTDGTLVDLAQDGKRWSATFFFPRTGEYDLSLYGKRRSDGTSARIGRVRLWAAVSASAAPAEGWTLSPRFRKYGFDIVSTSPADVEDEASAVISVPEGYDAELAFSDAASGQPVKTVSTFAEGPNRGMRAIFPESGQYELAILGGKKGAARLPEVARVTFVSAIDPSLPRFRLWQMENDWPKIPLESVSAVSGDWKPFDDLSLWRSHVRGLLAHQFVLPVGEQSLVLRRGSSVELAADDAFLAEVISFVLPSDLSAKAGTATVTFKAGSAFTFRPGDAAGVLARDTALFVEGNALYCPRGSRLLLHGSEPRQVDLSGSGTFAAAGKIYACSGSVIITPLSDGRSTLKISTAKPIALQFGSTKFVLPAGSQMVFRDGVLDYLVFARDFSLPLRTERRRIPAGWAARFDVQGAVEITKPE